MRHAAASFAVLIFAGCVHAEGYGPGLTVLLDFQEAASSKSMDEMEREVQQLLKPAGVRVHMRLVSEVRPGDNMEDLVLVKFRGACNAGPDPMLLDERGPSTLAFAHTADGKVQPFSEVACASVRRAVNSALWGREHERGEELFGRALGRVVAHELVHILGNTPVHGKSGVFKQSLSGRQLIVDDLHLSREDMSRLRAAHPAEAR